VAIGTSTVNWSGNVIDDVFNNGAGYDSIRGNDAGNKIQSIGNYETGTSGSVELVRAEGGDDTVDCGEGSDRVTYDNGDELIGCETQTQQ
jgi:hypothetical protein